MSIPSVSSLSLFDRLWKRCRKWQHYPYVTYQAIAFVGRNKANWRFMNYGFDPIDSPRPELEAQDEVERVSVQLYHFVASGAVLQGKDVLEIGSGRGGGSEFMHRYFKSGTMTGMDFAPTAVEFCQNAYKSPGLRYLTGNAMQLPFPDQSFDVVVNVESAHLYPDPERFVSEVMRVLRPGGSFLYADVLPRHLYSAVRPRLEAAGFQIKEERDISPEVLQSLNLDSERRKALVSAWAPWPLKSFAAMFAVVGGSYPYEKLRTGRSLFFRFVATKP